jgi:dTDP-4-amino-4,6-dideoxygalactose transaminase
MEYLRDSFASGHLAGDGPFTARAVEQLSVLVGADRILLTPSCTAALEMSALLVGVGPGDEVIVPSFTFVSTANAFHLMGATPVFADIDPVTLNIDPASVERLVTDRTRAILAMHYGGRPCDMTRLAKIAEGADCHLVEDAAHALFAAHDGVPLGTFGSLATFSFHETKNLSCGEGGALVVNDQDLWDRACVIREKGTDRTRFMQGLVDKYTWVDTGSSYLLADPLAAVLLAQIEHAPTSQRVRARAVGAYEAELAGWAAANEVGLPAVPAPGDTAAHHLMPLLFPDGSTRNAFIDHCRRSGVQSVFHYLPLHRSPMAVRMGADAGSCPVTDSVSERLARLPVFSDMREDELDHVLSTVQQFAA